jgi:hypothetical protein
MTMRDIVRQRLRSVAGCHACAQRREQWLALLQRLRLQAGQGCHDENYKQTTNKTASIRREMASDYALAQPTRPIVSTNVEQDGNRKHAMPNRKA